MGGRTRDLGVATEMGSGVGPEGDVGNSLIRSAVGSFGCRSTENPSTPSSALKRTKHHQSDPSNVPRILGSS